MKTRLITITAILLAHFPFALPAQDWRDEARHFFVSHRYQDRIADPDDFQDIVELDAPEGYLIVNRPDSSAAVLQRIEAPSTIRATRFIEHGNLRFYLTAEEMDRSFETGIPPTWIVIPGTGRGAFIEASQPAQMLKKEKRDDPKLGPVNAEVYGESVPVFEETVWEPGFRRAEIDFVSPAKVNTFRAHPDGTWEVAFTIFPAFHSDTDRIPGPRPEFYDDPYRVLISTPNRREVTLRGTLRAEEYRALLVPDTVWAAGFSEGRLQHLRIGYSWLPPEVECSPLSNPIFREGERLAFRFLASRLHGAPVPMEVVPDRIIGVDYTDYTDLANLRPEESFEPEDPDDTEVEFGESPDEWSITLSPRLLISVVAPLTEGRGAAGMLELESLGLGSTYEDDLKALRSFWDVPPSEFGAEVESPWIRFTDRAMGEIPALQRARP